MYICVYLYPQKKIMLICVSLVSIHEMAKAPNKFACKEKKVLSRTRRNSTIKIYECENV